MGVTSAANAATDEDLTVNEASDFAAALVNHEIGHALGRRDKRDNSMMDDRMGFTEQPNPPNADDKKKLADELKKLQDEVKH